MECVGPWQNKEKIPEYIIGLFSEDIYHNS